MSAYGRPGDQWSFWCKRPKTKREKERVIIESILTQRTNWRNVERAMSNLEKAKFDSLRRIARLKKQEMNRLVSCIKPSGFYRQKAGYLVNLAKFVVESYGGVGKKMAKEPLSKLRMELLALKGIGPETADSILLYALEKPIFVIDKYTKRLLRARGISPVAKYEELRELFEKSLPRDYRLYQDFHALVVVHGKNQNKQ